MELEETKKVDGDASISIKPFCNSSQFSNNTSETNKTLEEDVVVVYDYVHFYSKSILNGNSTNKEFVSEQNEMKNLKTEYEGVRINLNKTESSPLLSMKSTEDLKLVIDYNNSSLNETMGSEEFLAKMMEVTNKNLKQK